MSNIRRTLVAAITLSIIALPAVDAQGRGQGARQGPGQGAATARGGGQQMGAGRRDRQRIHQPDSARSATADRIRRRDRDRINQPDSTWRGSPADSARRVRDRIHQPTTFPRPVGP
ncbi:MAG TPA: hypothetical protein VEA99_00520 [Gemmatimonadaceae bacterium]|nr:hypothetical protein [Gemmatimonadaceae bacterium]